MKQAINQRQKVLYLITKATWGGAQKYVFDLATNLPRDQFEPVVAHGVEGKLAHDLSLAGIKVRQLPSLGRDIAVISDIRGFFEILKTIKEMRPDVIHLNSSKAAALGALAARIAGVRKIIFTVHGWPFKEDRNVLARLFIYLASWITALTSHRVIVVSRADEKIGMRMFSVARKIVRIPLGYTQGEQLSPPEGFRKMFAAPVPPPVSPRTLRIVTIAELTRNKGIRFGIDAIRELKDRNIDSIYVVAGEGEDTEFLVSYAKERGVGDRVFFPGFVAEAARALPGFDVFLLPSTKEGMPNVLLEASAAHLPIVATSAIDAEDAAQFSSIRIVPIADVSAIADAVLELSSRVRSQKNENQFPLSLMVDKTIALYLPA